MARVELKDDTLTIHVDGFDKVLALKSSLSVPLEHVLGAEVNDEIANRWWKGFKLPGTNLPGVVAAGSFYQTGEGELQGFTFWDVHNPDSAIVISLQHEHYKRLVIGVADPAAAVAEIASALEARGQR